MPTAPATADTDAVVRATKEVALGAWRPGYRYAKAGVMLYAIEPAGRCQLSLLVDPVAQAKSARLMKALDAVNAATAGKPSSSRARDFPPAQGGLADEAVQALAGPHHAMGGARHGQDMRRRGICWNPPPSLPLLPFMLPFPQAVSLPPTLPSPAPSAGAQGPRGGEFSSWDACLPCRGKEESSLSSGKAEANGGEGKAPHA